MGSLQLPDLVQGIMRAKPGIKGAQLAAAVNAALPLMNAQGLSQWRQLQGQLGVGRLANQTANTGDEITNRDANTGLKRQSFAERKSEFQQRQASVNERFDRTMDEKLTALAATNDRAEAGRLATDVREAIRAKAASDRQAISAANSFDDSEKPKLAQEAAKAQDEAQGRLDDAIKAQRSAQDRNASKAKPEAAKADGTKDPMRVPGGGATDRPTTITAPDGKKWTYKGTGDYDDQANWSSGQ
jgi:hypothetical protein